MVPPALEAFGLWVEQLIAESTGKQGKGVIPIAGEAVGPAEQYGEDRLFVRLSVRGAPTDVAARSTDNVRSTYVDQALLGPAVEIELPEATALGAEFMRWEIATAIVGAMLQINPFDEPNVQQAKDATRVLLDAYKTKGRLPAAAADLTLPTGARLALSQAARTRLGAGNADAIITLIEEGDYFALLAYVGPDEAIARELRKFRQAVRDRTRAATMFGYGPRYLHSTGQLHKGGPNTGVFVLLTAEPDEDLPIPGESVFVRHTRARSGARRFRLARRDQPARIARAPAPSRIRRWCAKSPTRCWRGCRSGRRDSGRNVDISAYLTRSVRLQAGQHGTA